MSKSLAELRQSPRVGLPERSYELCLASALVSEVQSLLAELEHVAATEAAQAEGDEQAARPRRMGDGAESKRIRARLSDLYAEMSDHTGTLTIKGVTEGDWRLWVDAHPARKDNARDNNLAYGLVNIDALVDDLARFASAWNGEPFGPGDWDFIGANASPADLRAIAQLVVAMHEGAVDVPKWLNSLPGIRGDANA